MCAQLRLLLIAFWALASAAAAEYPERPIRLTVRLRHDDTGTTVTLWNSDGGAASFFDVFVTLDDQSGQPWTGVGSGGMFTDLTGSTQAQNPLAPFNGESMTGTWSLLFNDPSGFAGEGDDLLAWSLDVNFTPEPGSLALLGLGLLGLAGMRRRVHA